MVDKGAQTPRSAIALDKIQGLIFTIRGMHVMVDRDLATVYEVETKVLNQAVKRNLERFPAAFRFQLSDDEKNELVTDCDRFESLKHASTNPYVFTEQGVSMLSAVLRSETAIKVSIQIINAFVEMRHFLHNNASIFARLDSVEKRQLAFQIKAEENFDRVFNALEAAEPPKQGIFYDGQVHDAHAFVSSLIRKAKKSMTLIDNYVDDTVSRKAPRVVVYAKESKLETTSDITGTKGYAVGFQGLVQYIVTQLPQNEVIEKALRKESKLVPEVVIRELVANALIH